MDSTKLGSSPGSSLTVPHFQLQLLQLQSTQSPGHWPRDFPYFTSYKLEQMKEREEAQEKRHRWEYEWLPRCAWFCAKGSPPSLDLIISNLVPDTQKWEVMDFVQGHLWELSVRQILNYIC